MSWVLLQPIRLKNAQYTPDIDKYNETNKGGKSVQTLSNLSDEISTNEFTDLINQYAKVDNYAGAGKYLGYDIYEIKDEIKFVVETVPAFNQWFRMPTMREEEGFISIPYYEN